MNNDTELKDYISKEIESHSKKYNLHFSKKVIGRIFNTYDLNTMSYYFQVIYDDKKIVRKIVFFDKSDEIEMHSTRFEDFWIRRGDKEGRHRFTTREIVHLSKEVIRDIKLNKLV